MTTEYFQSKLLVVSAVHKAALTPPNDKQLTAQQLVMMISTPYTAMHIMLFCSIMRYTRPRLFTLRTSWTYRPRLSSPIFGVALRIILTQTSSYCNIEHLNLARP